MNTIISREELLQAVKTAEQVVLCEKEKVARGMVRFLMREGLDEKIEGIAVFREMKNDQKKVFGKRFQEIKYFEENKDALYMVIQLRNEAHLEVLDTLQERGYRNVALVDYEVFASILQEENPHLDFACVGFTKCGTTSLSAALRKLKEVYLPKGKETFYLHWYNKYENAPDKLKKKYFAKVPEGKIVGNIEPSYHLRAREAYECFGPDLKVIFMMRNPAGATFSYYKMMIRRPRSKEYVDYYKKYHKYTPDMFNDFIEGQVLSGKKGRFKYDLWIKEYMEYFPKEQIKCIFLEDIIADPEAIMDEVQEFIGVQKKKKYKTLPHSNEGNFVSKNYLSAFINYRYYFAIRNKKENENLNAKKKLFMYLAPKLQKYTTIEANDKLRPEDRKMLMDYYRDSIKEVEKLTGRDLNELWHYDE